MDIPNASPFDVAQVCLNGHIINSHCEDKPQDSKKFCPDCGEKTIHACLTCNTSIEGFARHTAWDSGYITPYELHSYCGNCGSPFPWISFKLDAAQELADIVDEFNEKDRELLVASLKDLVRDTPRAQIAVLNFKKILLKADSPTQDAFRSILYSIIASPLSKLIWG